MWSYRIQKEIGATRFGRLPRRMCRIPVPQRDTIGTAAHMTATVANFMTMGEGMSQGGLIPTEKLQHPEVEAWSIATVETDVL